MTGSPTAVAGETPISMHSVSCPCTTTCSMSRRRAWFSASTPLIAAVMPGVSGPITVTNTFCSSCMGRFLAAPFGDSTRAQEDGGQDAQRRARSAAAATGGFGCGTALAWASSQACTSVRCATLRPAKGSTWNVLGVGCTSSRSSRSS
jgi:hypothetical protein